MTRLIFVRFLVAFGSYRARGSRPRSWRRVSPPPDTSPTAVTRQEVWQAWVRNSAYGGWRPNSCRGRGFSICRWLCRRVPAGRCGFRRSVGKRSSSYSIPLECGAPGQCLPFLVYVRDSAGNDVRGSFNADASAEPGRAGWHRGHARRRSRVWRRWPRHNPRRNPRCVRETRATRYSSLTVCA